MGEMDFESFFQMEERLNEGGYVSEEYFSDLYIPQEALPEGYSQARPAASMIYYLLKPEDVSRWHLVSSDEIWIWRAGGTIEITLSKEGKDGPDKETYILGPNWLDGDLPHLLVKGGTWQTARPLSNESTLVNCVVVPGFSEDDYTEGTE